MKRQLSLVVAAAGLLQASHALPCGMPFGEQMTFDPAQHIVIAHHQGVETYVFRPYFCGAAAEFGLILPIPTTLSSDPALASGELYDELEEISAPSVETVTQCKGGGGGCGAAEDGLGFAGDAGGTRNGVDVIDQGQVGLFDWVLLQATDQAAFTDWLDTNGYPYDSGAASHFSYYVTKAWYFVAFKVTADSEAPPAGMKLCGELGPIQLQFASPQPVIPARITQADTASSYEYFWRVYLIAAQQQELAPAQPFSAELYFSQELTTSSLSPHPRLTQLAAAGDRLTVLDVRFSSAQASGDIEFAAAPAAADFRSTVIEYVYEDCGAVCSAWPSTWFTGAFVLLILGVAMQLFRRSEQRRR